jgi:hypothetical protein
VQVAGALDKIIGHFNRKATIASDAITMTRIQNGPLATERRK